MKTIKYIIAAVSTAMLMTSCHDAGDAVAPTAVNISNIPIEYGFDRTRVANNQFEEGDKFAVWSDLFLGDGTHVPYFSEQIVTLTGNAWAADKKYYWPTNGHLDFFAIYPSPSSSLHGKNKIEVTPGPQPVVDYHIYNFADMCDIMAAKTTKVECDNPQVVPIHFQHLLGRIDFMIKNNCNYGVGLDIEVEAVEVYVNMHEHGRLKWGEDDEKISIETYGDTNLFSQTLSTATKIAANGTAKMGTLYFMPEDVGTIKVHVKWNTYNGGMPAAPYDVKAEIPTDFIVTPGKATPITFGLSCDNSDPNNGGHVHIVQD